MVPDLKHLQKERAAPRLEEDQQNDPYRGIVASWHRGHSFILSCSVRSSGTKLSISPSTRTHEGNVHHPSGRVNNGQVVDAMFARRSVDWILDCRGVQPGRWLESLSCLLSAKLRYQSYNGEWQVMVLHTHCLWRLPWVFLRPRPKPADQYLCSWTSHRTSHCTSHWTSQWTSQWTSHSQDAEECSPLI